ncbi:flavin reductase (DIM6/NTAB) family NADH-FMN oxidoreductase RutF [Stackebrandtia albiflava]|uniref:Flavin reductase (DIM6/NTAB) family NADH-FMN oxidoreductase RutF n=1 Tax=Stackebrandtia albiflava TaxID=406432 RepID=A0A562VCA5_9ACTN|nr:flavin reductase family protein [Stackebrandtia albiflava]TWJ15523.1 flavin reductase (DIM6/NTAB) family NADH-FMN oxidoreductase RutF [Stackebrandtia albiflava]
MTLLEPAGVTAPAGADPSRALRRVLGHFATGVTVVTTTDASGAPVGLTVNSFTSVSLRPPMVLWCLQRTSRSRAAFQRSGHYAVNVLAEDQRDLAGRFAGERRHGAGERRHGAGEPGHGADGEPDRFAGVGWQLGVAGQPILDGVSAWLVCRLQGTGIPAGDHIVLFGRVLAHRAGQAPPLVFAHGRYRHLDPRTG